VVKTQSDFYTDLDTGKSYVHSDEDFSLEEMLTSATGRGENLVSGQVDVPTLQHEDDPGLRYWPSGQVDTVTAAGRAAAAAAGRGVPYGPFVYNKTAEGLRGFPGSQQTVPTTPYETLPANFGSSAPALTLNKVPFEGGIQFLGSQLGDKDEQLIKPKFPGAGKSPYKVPEGSRLAILQGEIREDWNAKTMTASNLAEAHDAIRVLGRWMTAVQFVQDPQSGKVEWMYLGKPLYEDASETEKVWEVAARQYPREDGTPWKSYEDMVAALDIRDAYELDAVSIQNEYVDLGKKEEQRQAELYRDERQGTINAALQEHQAALEQYYNELASRNLSGADRERLEVERRSALQLAQEQGQQALDRVQTEIAGRQSSMALEHESRQILQEQEYDLKFQLQMIEQAFAQQQADLNRALQAEQLIEVRRHAQTLEALEAERNVISAQVKNLEFFNMIADQPQILFFAGASGMLQGLGDIAGDGGTAVQNIMNSLNAMPAMNNLQEFVNMSGLEQGIESMRLSAQTGLTGQDVPAYLRGMGPMALEHRRAPLDAPIAPGAPPLGGDAYQGLLREQMGMDPAAVGTTPGYIPEVRPGAEERLGGYAPVGSILEQMSNQVSGQTTSTFDASGYPTYVAPDAVEQRPSTFDWDAILPKDWSSGQNKNVVKEVDDTIEEGKQTAPDGNIFRGHTQPTERDFVMPWTALTEAPGLPKGVYIRKADLGVLRQGWDKIMPLLWKYKLVQGGQGVLKGQGGPDWTEETAPDWVKELPSWGEWVKGRGVPA
jgi:hypothetical protein